MQLTQWFRNTALISFLFFSFAPGDVYAVCDVSAGTCEGCTADEAIACVEQIGESNANAVAGKLGTKAGIKSNAANPLSSSNTPMTTIDGSKSFDAQMLCPSSNKYLQVFVQPAATGDLGQVIISQDLDMDSTFDYSYTIPFTVSGVCSNGVISCSAGTWTGCTHYKWIADSTGKAELQGAQLTDLGGCYCINSACGSNLVWNNIGVMLKDLGGGIAGAIQAGNPQFTISDVKVQDTVISYYGQKSGSCSNSWTGTASPDLYKYKSNWPTLTSGAETERLSQESDPDSYYNLLTTSLAAQQSPFAIQECNIIRGVTCSGNDSFLGGTGYEEGIIDGCVALEANTTCKLKEETVDSVYTYRNFNPTGLFPLATCTTVVSLKTATCTITGATCGSWSYTCPLDSSIGCTLGVCYQSSTFNVCQPWWGKKRTYFCQTAPMDFSDIQKRVKNIKDTSTDNITSLYYQDLRKDENGNWITENKTIELGKRGTYGDCELVCKAKRQNEDTQVTLAGHTGQLRSQTVSHVFAYKSCIHNACPLAAGETLEKDCQCIDDFGEAATTMQVLRLLEKDIICSDGVPKPL